MFAKKKTTRLSFTPFLVLTLLVIVIGLPAAQAQKYSDWSTPVSLGPVINSAFNDQQPAISKDGLSLYFTSNRPGGLGGFDMYVSQRACVDDPWGSPVNLGATVNTTFDEGNPAFSRDEHLLFFQSKRPGGFGGIDLWVSQRESTLDPWSTPVNLGNTINTVFLEQNAYLSSDNRTLLFSSDRPGGSGGLDLYMSTRTKLH